MQTIFRSLTHKALAQHQLNGEIIDLGGGNHAEYAGFIKGNFTRYSANLNPASKPDFIADFEEPLKLESDKFDGVLLINVLEHIYHAHQLAREAWRILKPSGTVIVTVPYIMAIHPSPHDYYRFSEDALRSMFTEAGFSKISIKPIGSGVFIARHMLLSRLIPNSIQLITEYPTRIYSMVLDKIWTATALFFKKKYTPADYPLGYILVATKE